MLEIKSEVAAALLLKDKTRRLLAPFALGKKSMKEASEALSIKLTTYYPYVKRFENAGLIEVVEVIARAGRSIKRYRTVADEFFIPHTLSPLLAHFEEIQHVSHNTLLQAMSRAWLESTDETNAWGFRFYVDPRIGFTAMGARSKGEPWDLLSGERPIVLPYWRKLKLSRDKARSMQRELQEVLERYTEEQDGRDDYLIRIAMAPSPKEE